MATVKAQQNPQNSEQLQNAVNIVNNLSKVLAGMANVLGNPAILLNGELGENVRSVVDDTNKIVVSLDETLENLIAALGLEAG